MKLEIELDLNKIDYDAINKQIAEKVAELNVKEEYERRYVLFMDSCENRLPCGWCKRENNRCKVVKKNNAGLTCIEEIDRDGRISKIFDSKPDCSHRWSWQRSTSKGDMLYVCEDCGAIKKIYPRNIN